MAGKTLIEGPHQIGKEFALIFDETEEKEPENIFKFLNILSKKFIEEGIEPEKGHVLTFETQELIADCPENEQENEKGNLKAGKFDRAIPHADAEAPTFFHYRHEDGMAMDCTEEEIAMYNSPNLFPCSYVEELVQKKSPYVHAPLCVRKPQEFKDPYINFVLSN